MIIFSNIITCDNIIQYYMEDENFQKINIFELWSLHCLFMNVNSLCLAKNIEKYYSWLWWSRVKILDFSLVMTITTCNIFQYFLPAMYYYLIPIEFSSQLVDGLFRIFFSNTTKWHVFRKVLTYRNRISIQKNPSLALPISDFFKKLKN